MRRLMVALSVGAAVGLLAPGAHAMVCQNKKGKITVRKECKKKETEVAKVHELFPDDPITTLPPKEPTAGRVVDSGGQFVGAVTGTTYYGSTPVLRLINGTAFNLYVNRQGYKSLEEDQANFRFTTPDCSGARNFTQGYYGGSATPDDLAYPLTVVGNTGYYTDGTGATSVDKSSYLYRQTSSVMGAMLGCGNPYYGGGSPVGGPRSCDPKRNCGSYYGHAPAQCFCQTCCSGLQTTSSGTSILPAKTVDLGALGLTPPFKIEVIDR